MSKIDGKPVGNRWDGYIKGTHCPFCWLNNTISKLKNGACDLCFAKKVEEE